MRTSAYSKLPLPQAFVRRMERLLEQEAAAFFAALEQPAMAGLRVNTIKIAPEDLRALTEWPLNKVPWSDCGFVVKDSEAIRPGRHAYHAAGLYYLQEPSAMAVGAAVAPRPEELIIDLAAAPGGKSTHLVALAGDRSMLVANDVKGNRLRILGQQLERWGATRAAMLMEPVARLAAHWGTIFDRVLLDAPCSGEGMFRKSPPAMRHWSESAVIGAARRQRRLLRDAARLVKPGGRLVYSTCTFAPEENEQVIAEFLDAERGFRLVDPGLTGAENGRPDWVSPAVRRDDLALTRRLWPHLSVGEGHFVAALERTDGVAASFQPARFHELEPRIEREWQELAAATFATDPAEGRRLTMFGNKLFAVPEQVPDLRGLRASRCGLWLAISLKGRLQPAHSLAMAVPVDLARHRLDFEPDAEGLLRFLRGELVEAPGDDGWVLVSVSRFPVGWGRRKTGVVQNLLPKGLRVQSPS